MPRVKRVSPSEDRVDRLADLAKRDHNRILRLQDEVRQLVERVRDLEEWREGRMKAGRPPVQFEACTEWLAHLLETKGACRSTWIMREGEKLGFKSALIRRVAKVLEVEKGVGHVWRLIPTDGRRKIPTLVLGHSPSAVRREAIRSGRGRAESVVINGQYAS